MRVTTKMLSSNFSRNINNNLGALQKIQNQLNTGKLVSKPSDDPFLATRIMDYETEIARKEQYERNINDVTEMLDMTDTTLGQVTDQMNRLNELSIQALNDTNSEEDLKLIAEEVDQIMNSMVDTLNTSFQDKYIYAGTDMEQPPFELVDGEVIYHGNSEKTQVEVSNGVFVDRNTTGDQVLGGVTVTEADGSTTTYNLFESITELSNALKTNDKETLKKFQPQLEEHTDNILQLRGQVGAVQNRMESTLDKTKEEILGLTELLSKAGDVDYAEKYIEYKTLEASYTASLQVSAQIIQPSLLNFLR